MERTAPQKGHNTEGMLKMHWEAVTPYVCMFALLLLCILSVSLRFLSVSQGTEWWKGAGEYSLTFSSVEESQ